MGSCGPSGIGPPGDSEALPAGKSWSAKGSRKRKVAPGVDSGTRSSAPLCNCTARKVRASPIPLPDVFGGEVEIEDFIANFGRNSRAGVLHLAARRLARRQRRAG